MSEYKLFAYGKDTIGSCPCPAVAAGHSPKDGDETTHVAEWYDDVVRQLDFDNADSVISEEQAKEAWLETINQMESGHRGNENVGREIAETLGWL